MYQYYALETFLIIILVFLVYLNQTSNLHYKYVLIYLFFFMASSPFIFYGATKEKFIDYDNDMRSSLDVLYLNTVENRQDEVKTCPGICSQEEKEHHQALPKQKLYKKPFQIELDPQNIVPTFLTAHSNISGEDMSVKLKIGNMGLPKTLKPNSKMGLNLYYFPFDKLVNYNGTDDFFIDFYVHFDLNKVNVFEKIKEELEKIPQNTFILFGLYGKVPGNFITNRDMFVHEVDELMRMSNLLKFNKMNNGYLALLKKNVEYTLIKEVLGEDSSIINYNLTGKEGKYLEIKELGVKLKNVKPINKIKSILDEDSLQAEYLYLTPRNQNSYLSFESDNNNSTLFLANVPINNQKPLYYTSPDIDGKNQYSIYLKNNVPQKWTFIPNTPSGYDHLFRIRTLDKPYFYLEMNGEKVSTSLINDSSSGLWKFKKINNKVLLVSVHTGLFLSYNNQNSAVYQNTGSVYGSDKKNMFWDFVLSNKKKIYNVPPPLDNPLQDDMSPNDYPSVENPKFQVKGNYLGQQVNLESNGRGLWQRWFAPIWNGSYIYYGTVKDKNKFFRIQISTDGKTGIATDTFANETYQIKSIGSDVLFGYSGEIKIYIKMISSNLKYQNPRQSYPVKIQIIINNKNDIFTLCGNNRNNLDAYAVKYDGDDTILSNYLESYGIPVAIKKGLGFPK